jgi:hypothetical protein
VIVLGRPRRKAPCLKGTIGGHDALLTARGATAAEFQANLAAIKGLLDAPVQAAAQSTPAATPAPQAAREEHCALHDAKMYWNEPKNGGRGWFSHKTDDARFEEKKGFCRGGLPKQARR